MYLNYKSPVVKCLSNSPQKLFSSFFFVRLLTACMKANTVQTYFMMETSKHGEFVFNARSEFMK